MKNKDYDEALDITGSTIESYNTHDEDTMPKRIVPSTKIPEEDDKLSSLKSTIVQDQSYDEALEVSASTMDSQEIKTPTQFNKSSVESKTKSPNRKRLLTQDSDQIDAFRNTKKSTMSDNQHWDEALDLSTDGEQSMDTDDGLERRQLKKKTEKGGDSPPINSVSDFGRQEYNNEDTTTNNLKSMSPLSGTSSQKSMIKKKQKMAMKRSKLDSLKTKSDDEDDSENDESGDSDSGDSEDGDQKTFVAGYDPDDYKNLKCDDDVKDLFAYISRYKPPAVELETKLRCFIPDYIPTIGEIDPFVKVPRPDGKPDHLGLTVLDEGAAEQSDATVLELQLRSFSKKSNLGEASVRSIERADRNPKEITKWIESIEELHRKRPPPKVDYITSMPDIDQLMQVWPSEFESLLKDITLPSADMDMTLDEFSRVICGLLDIPVEKSLIESLHVLFTLYHEFRSNAHFQNMAGGNGFVVPIAGSEPGVDDEDEGTSKTSKRDVYSFDQVEAK